MMYLLICISRKTAAAIFFAQPGGLGLAKRLTTDELCLSFY
jgi:hypothetical protein